MRNLKEIYIPGGFDLLHQDHRNFISSCISGAAEGHRFDRVVIGLMPDVALSRKGTHRPFYCFDWRAQDLKEWFQSTNHRYELQVRPAQRDTRAPEEDTGERLIVVETGRATSPLTEALGKLYSGVLVVNPQNKFHTSDVEKILLETASASNCNRLVGAVLLRDGQVQAAEHNGGGPGSCEICPKYVALMREYRDTGIKKPTPVPCIYPHAEERCAAVSLPGDHLLVTLAPCQNCAETIIERGISRVVYLKPYSDETPVAFLKDRGVQVRQAGLAT